MKTVSDYITYMFDFIKIKSNYINGRTLIMVLVMTNSLVSLPPAVADEYWDQKTSLFELLPINEEDIVFVGNSITDGGEFAELFEMSNIKNRGIRSDVITGVEKRISQITSGKPSKIFLLIGINDVSHGLSVTELGRRYERLVRRIRSESPESRLYLQSVMPINNTFRRYKNLNGKENIIANFNKEIARIAEANGAEYIDLTRHLTDSNGRLRSDLTNDGLHLNGRGYRVWTETLKPYVAN